MYIYVIFAAWGCLSCTHWCKLRGRELEFRWMQSGAQSATLRSLAAL